MPLETTQPAPPTAAAPPFDSLAALRAEHLRLMRLAKSAAPPDDLAERVNQFLGRARSTGTRIDGVAEREAAQGILDYWTAALFSLPHPGRPLAGPVFLEPFDPAQAPDLSDKPCPYMGLSAFGEGNADRFFGREEALKALADKVARAPVVVVTGPSGSGKSSLVLAGLVPRVRAAGERAVLPVVVPGSDPLGALLQAVRPPDADPRAWVEAEAHALARDPARFAGHVAGAAGGRPALLVIDQFEELFTLCPDQRTREAFAAAVAAVGQEPGGGRVVITIREDYLTQALGLPALKALAADPEVRFSPPPMSSRELRRVIERPAERVGLKFEDGVVDELVKEVVGEPTALPLLQFALARLWAARERNRITWEAYRAVGSPREALKRTADEVYRRLPQDLDRQVARLVFLELVRPAVGVEVVRRRVRREALRQLAAAGTVDAVLERLVAAGLLRRTPGADADDDRFEVAHEALTRNWPLLAGWLDEARRESATRLQLESTARLWLESGRQRGYLLSGAALADAMRYRNSGPEVRELIDASEAAQRHWYRMAIYAVVGVAVLLAVLAVMAGIGWWRQYSTDKELIEAENKLDQEKEASRLAEEASRARAFEQLREEDQRQAVLTAAVQFIRALGELETTRNAADQRLAVARLEGLADTTDQELIDYFKRHNVDLRAMIESFRARPDQSPEHNALQFGHMMREELIKEKDPLIINRLTAMRQVTYRMVRTCAEQIVNLIGKSYSDAQPYILEFWVLYWGEMGLVEDTKVARAMVDFGNQLKKIDEHMTEKLPAETQKKLKTAELYRHPVHEVASLVKSDGADNKLADLVKELGNLQRALSMALDDELHQPINPDTPLPVAN
jgi:hypothetical protein